MIDGIYSVSFRGHADWGMGLLVLQQGIITGADQGGVLYDGRYVDRGANVEVAIQITVPAGARLVQGTAPQLKPYAFEFNAVLPKAILDTGAPVTLDMPPGPVNAIFRRLRSLSV